MKNLRKDVGAFLGLEKPWNLIGAVIIFLCGASIWLHNGEAMQNTIVGDIYNMSPVIFGVGVCIMISGYNLGFKNDWRWMVMMLIGAAVFWYCIPMGNAF